MLINAIVVPCKVINSVKIFILKVTNGTREKNIIKDTELTYEKGQIALIVFNEGWLSFLYYSNNNV